MVTQHSPLPRHSLKMSLEYLPNELLNSILHYTTKSELFALSLVSKRLSLYARPLVRTILYRSVELVVSTRYMEERLRESGVVHFEQRIRDNFLQTILHDPTCAANIETLELVIEPSRLLPEIKDQIIFLLRSCINIRHLRLARPRGSGEGDVPVDVLSAIPPTLTTMGLRWRPLGPEGLGLVLRKITSLRTLDLTASDSIQTASLTFPGSKSVRYLSLPLDPFRLHPILPTLLSSLPRLIRFTGSISSAQFLAQVPLVELQTLKLACPRNHSNFAKLDQGKILTSLSEDLTAALQRTPNLRTLEICISSWWWELKEMTLSIFHGLPISLTSLKLLGSPLLPFNPLLDYLVTSSRSRNLKRVTIGVLEGTEFAGGVRFDENYAKLKAISKDRKISCYYTDQAPSWARC